MIFANDNFIFKLNEMILSRNTEHLKRTIYSPDMLKANVIYYCGIKRWHKVMTFAICFVDDKI